MWRCSLNPSSLQRCRADYLYKKVGLTYGLWVGTVSCQRCFFFFFRKETCGGPTVLVTSFAVRSFGRNRKTWGGSSRWRIHAMPSFHVCRQVRCVTSVLDGHTALFADYMRLVEFPFSLKKSKIIPNVWFIRVFWGIKYLPVANIALIPLHVRCVLSASVRERGSNGAFRVRRKLRSSRT